MSQPKINLACIVSDLFGENTFVAQLEERQDCVVIDPGLEPQKIVRYLEQNRLTPAAILITHGHSDHIGEMHYLRRGGPTALWLSARPTPPN